MKKVLLLTLMATLILGGCSLKKAETQKEKTKTPGGIAAEFDSEQGNQGEQQSANQDTGQTPPAVTLEDIAGVTLKTNFGDMKLAFYGKESPTTVTNFINLAAANFYNNVKFHRVIKGFMIQTGDPNSKDDDWSNDGTGGPGYTFPDEFNEYKLVKGSLAMANSGPNTNGSQFFIVTAEDAEGLDGKHTNFGYVVEGMDVVEKIENVAINENDHPTEDVIIQGILIELTEEGQKKIDEANQKQAEAAAQQAQQQPQGPQAEEPQAEEDTGENPQEPVEDETGETVNPQEM